MTMNYERVAAALRLLADALEDRAEAVLERTAIQHEPPTCPPPAPLPPITAAEVTAQLNALAKQHGRAALTAIVGSRKVAALSLEGLAALSAELVEAFPHE